MKYSSGERCILGNTHPERCAFWGSNFLVEVRPGKYSSGERCILGNTHPEKGAFWEILIRREVYSGGVTSW